MTTKAARIKARLRALENARPDVPEWHPIELFAQIIKQAEAVKAGDINADNLDADIKKKILEFIKIWDELENEC